LPTSLNLLFVNLSIDYDRNGHYKGSPFFIEKFQILAPNKKTPTIGIVSVWFWQKSVLLWPLQKTIWLYLSTKRKILHQHYK